MGIIGNVASKGMNQLKKRTGKDERKDLSENEKTLNKVFKSIGKAIAKVFSYLLSLLLSKFGPIILAVVCIGVLIGGLLNVFNNLVEQDTEGGVKTASILVAINSNNPQFESEIFQMIANGEGTDAILERIKEELTVQNLESQEHIDETSEIIYRVLRDDYNNNT